MTAPIPTPAQVETLRQRAAALLAQMPADHPMADAIREIVDLQAELDAVVAERDELRAILAQAGILPQPRQE